jgi:hypothetical protein
VNVELDAPAERISSDAVLFVPPHPTQVQNVTITETAVPRRRSPGRGSEPQLDGSTHHLQQEWIIGIAAASSMPPGVKP